MIFLSDGGDTVRELPAYLHPHSEQSWLPRLMRVINPEAMTVLEWLRRAPRKRSTKDAEGETPEEFELDKLGHPDNDDAYLR